MPVGSLCSWFASAIFTEADHAACGDVPVVLLTKAVTCCTRCVASVAVMLQVSATVAALHVSCMCVAVLQASAADAGAVAMTVAKCVLQMCLQGCLQRVRLLVDSVLYCFLRIPTVQIEEIGILAPTPCHRRLGLVCPFGGYGQPMPHTFGGTKPHGPW